MDKYEDVTYYEGYFRGVSNIGKSLLPFYQVLDEGDAYGTNAICIFGVFTV